MPRIIDGERNNMVGEQVRYYRKKKKIQPEAIIRETGSYGDLYLPGIYLSNRRRVKNGHRH